MLKTFCIAPGLNWIRMITIMPSKITLKLNFKNWDNLMNNMQKKHTMKFKGENL